MPMQDDQFSKHKKPTFNFSEPHDFAASHKRERDKQLHKDFQQLQDHPLSATPLQLDGPWEGHQSGEEYIELAKFTSQQQEDAEMRGSKS